MTVSRVLSVNEGYVAAGHFGANNILLIVESNYVVNDVISITAYAGNSWGIDRNVTRRDDEQLKTFFHTGMGFSCSFGNR